MASSRNLSTRTGRSDEIPWRWPCSRAAGCGRRRSAFRGRRGRRRGAREPGSRCSLRSLRLRRSHRGAVFGCGESGPLEDGAELSAILGKVDGFGLGAEHRHTCGLELVGQAQRGLAAEGAHDAEDLAGGELGMVDLHDVFERQRFEVQPIGGVVVGRHGLRVAVDHNRLESGRADRHGGVDARVVELDALTDPVRSGAEDDHGRAVARHDLGLGVVGRVVVRGLGFEFAGAGVDGLEHRAHAQGVADAGDDTGVEDAQGRDLLIGEAVVLRDRRACSSSSSASRI